MDSLSERQPPAPLTALATEAVDSALIPGAYGYIIAHGVGDAGVNVHLVVRHQRKALLFVRGRAYIFTRNI